MTGIRSYCINEKALNVATASRSVDPFCDSAVRKVTVIVNGGRPTRCDLEPSVAIGSYGCGEGPIFVLYVHQSQPGVVANTINNVIVHPRSYYISVMEARDCSKLLAGSQHNSV